MGVGAAFCLAADWDASAGTADSYAKLGDYMHRVISDYRTRISVLLLLRSLNSLILIIIVQKSRGPLGLNAAGSDVSKGVFIEYTEGSQCGTDPSIKYRVYLTLECDPTATAVLDTVSFAEVPGAFTRQLTRPGGDFLSISTWMFRWSSTMTACSRASTRSSRLPVTPARM